MAIVPHESKSLRRFGQSPKADFQPGQNYGALSWNIFKSKRKGWLHDFSQLHPIYDLLLLQEAKINFNLESLNHLEHYDPEYSWVFGESFAQDRGGSSCGVLTGSRIHQQHAFNRHAPVPEPFLNTPKSTAFAYYSIQAQEASLLVINSHFINFRQTSAFEQQLRQVLQVVDQHQGPILFAGDFNTWNRWRRELLLEGTAAHRLERVQLRNDSRNFLVLDHIFTRGLEIRDAHLLHGIESSDHLPLSLWFEIPG